MSRGAGSPVSAPAMRLSPRGYLRWCIAVGVYATAVSLPAAAAPFGTPGWFAQHQAGTPSSAAGAAPSPGAVVLPPAVTTPDQAVLHASRSIANLNRAADAIVAAQAAQTAARNLALKAPSDVPDGLAAGGLVVAAGAAAQLADPAVCAATNSCLWQNAELPTQALADGRTRVSVEQTAKKAILSWDSFNIGRDTTLRIDQSAGTAADGSNDWVALNRVSAGTSPSRILGRLEAEGSVYLINQNGFIFGGASEVNVHSLIVSSLPLYLQPGSQSLVPEDQEAYLRYSNALFLDTGINSIGPGTASGNILGFGSGQAVKLSRFGTLPGDIAIEAGASLRTGELGFSLIAAPDIRNSGTVAATDGQVILAAGIGVSLRDPASGSAVLQADLSGRVNDDGNRNADATPRSSLVNDGLVLSPRGNVRMLGFSVEQNGVVAATTSVSRPGSIDILALDQQAGDASPLRTGRLRLGPDSVTAVLPDGNDETTLSSPAADALFRTGAIRLSAGAVTLTGGSLLIAPGQDVSITAIGNSTLSFSGLNDGSVAGRLYVDDGAVIDVSGLADYRLPMSTHLVEVPRLGLNELADSPVQREGVLRGQPIVVDARVSGTRPDGVSWVGTPLANVGGYAQQVPRRIGQLLQDGGNVALAGNEVITRSGSQLLLDGGFVHYLGGVLETTRLVAANGAIIDIGAADPQVAYAGIAGVFTAEQPRWNDASTFRNPVLASQGGVYEPAYIDGGDAGSLSVFAQSALLLNGELSGRAFAGRRQVASGELPRGGRFVAGSGSLRSQAFPDTAGLAYGPSYVLQDEVPDIAALYGEFDALTQRPASALAVTDPDNPDRWIPISTLALREGGFGTLVVQAGGSTDGGEVLVREGTGLDLGRGGSVSLTGSRVTVRADIRAIGGSIRLVGTGNTGVVGSTVRPVASEAAPATGDIVIAPDVTLSTRGLWVNDAGAGAEGLLGPAFTNGGSISLETRQSVVFSESSGANCAGQQQSCIIDATGSILLGAGSVLDVSSGGRVLPDGRLAARDGVVQGRGGNLSLLTYAVGDAQFGGSDRLPLPDTLPRTGRIELGGTILSHGFSGGGVFAIRTLGLRIGPTSATADAGTLQLAPEWFEGQGFGSYRFVAEYDALIAQDSVVRPVQWSFLPDLAALRQLGSGTDLYAVARADTALLRIGAQDPFRRQATDLSIVAGDYLNWRVTGGGAPQVPGVSGALEMQRGAVIDADARADILLGSYRQLTIDGRIEAHGGTITLSADAADGGYAPLPGIVTNGAAYASSGKSVWLGAAAELDVSGVVLEDPLLAPVVIEGVERVPRGGVVLDGGAVVISSDTGHVVALGCADAGSCDDPSAPGARIDVSGAAGTFDLPSNSGNVLGPQAVWSDAGQIVIGAAAGLHFRATLSAHGGAPEARGGSLTVAPLTPRIGTSSGFKGARGLSVLSQTPDLPLAALRPGQAFPVGSSGQLLFGAELLDGSGIGSLYLGVDPRLGNATPPVPVSLDADLSLSLDRMLVINTAALLALPGADGAGSAVRLAAPLVRLHGYVPGASYPVLAQPATAPGDVSLEVTATNIDLGGQFVLGGIGEATFRAEEDLRLLTPSSYAYLASGDNLTEAVAVPGVLLSGGDLHFAATRIYPATGNRFVISAVAPDALVRFSGGTGEASAPISAGGSLLVSAPRIEQGGNLFAPAGQIVLGVNDPADPDTRALFSYAGVNRFGEPATLVVPVVATASVRLLPGSLTSVSLAGQVVPFGQTVDGQNWRYDGSATSTSGAASSVPDLAGPPEKQVVLAGAQVLAEAGATIDLRGGGDLQAQEWVAGTGGSRDVLRSFNTVYAGGTPVEVPLYADGREVWALLPDLGEGLAPYDPAIVEGDPLAGTSVYLSGMPDLPAGRYTLLPARYATLPGAYRVVQDTSVVDAAGAQNLMLPDGSWVVAGHFEDALDGSREARSTRFIVQSADTWRQYSQYELTSATAFFGAAAQGDSAPVRLPVDAGQLTLAAGSSLGLGAQLLASAGQGGAGALVDIAARRIQIVDADTVALEGYVQLRASELVSLEAGSLLIGGTRRREDEGDVVRALAEAIVVDNGAEVLRAPEIILTTTADSADDGIRVRAGSQLEATGSVAAGVVPDLILGRVSAPGQTAIEGDGALLRLSAGGAAAVVRRNLAPGTGQGGLLVLENGSELSAEGSLLLDSAGSTVVAPGVTLSAPVIDANSSRVTFLAEGYDGAAPEGLVIGAATLAQLSGADAIRLSSRGDMDFLGGVDITLDAELELGASRFRSDGSDVAIRAQAITLANAAAGTVAGQAARGDASLLLAAQTVVLAGGNKQISGFGEMELRASEGIILRGQGSLDAGAARLNLDAPALVVEADADSSLRTRGVISVTGATDTSLAAPALGGLLRIQGGSLELDTRILAPGGRVSLVASDGDVALGDSARVEVDGSAIPFFDQARAVEGGRILLQSEKADVRIAAGSLLDVSAAVGGDAGLITLLAPEGEIDLLGNLQGSAGEESRGGSLRAESLGAIDLDALAARIEEGGLDGRIAVRSGTGALQLGAGNTIRAEEISLVAEAESGGRVEIMGNLDVSGARAGEISLAGRQGVLVGGSLLASAEETGRSGGTVRLATSAGESTGTDVRFGHRSIDAAQSGEIRLLSSALLDVSGPGGGGLIDIRAPLLADGEIRVDVVSGASITGAREVSIEAYATWSTRDASSGALHFDGVVDPAGAFRADASAGPDADHRAFFQQTLMSFVQDPGFAFAERLAAIDGVRLRPGIELLNDDPSRLGGDILVLSDWNLGAGRAGDDGRLDLDYRLDGAVAPVLTLRARGDVLLQASLSDGFFQYSNPFAQSGGIDNSASPQGTEGNPLPLLSAGLATTRIDEDGAIRWEGVDSSSFRLVAGAQADSADPLAVARGASGSVILDGHQSASYRRRNGTVAAIVAPTMVRTGNGSISVVAAGDVLLRDTVAPGVIYTAGQPVPGTAAVPQVVIREGGNGLPVVLDTGNTLAAGAGDVLIRAGRDVVGVQRVLDDGSRTGRAGSNLSQYWWPWMQDGCWFGGSCKVPESARINFGVFGQGVLSVGGDVRVSAGRDLRELSISTPVTWRRSAEEGVQTFGGGDVRMEAGRDILSGSVFVARGAGRVEAGRDIVAGLSAGNGAPLSMLFALQDAAIDVSARGDVAIGGVFNPSYMFRNFDGRAYGTGSALNVVSAGGDISLGRVVGEFAFGARSGLSPAYGFVLPASLRLAALGGALRIDTDGELYPSASGQLELLAQDDIRFFNAGVTGARFGMIDALASRLPSALDPRFGQPLASSFILAGVTSAVDLHDPDGLHADDAEPVRIYSTNGSILNGAGSGLGAMVLDLPKRALIAAGLDIVDLALRGQHLRASDITRVQAGRDIYNTPLAPQRLVSFVELGGPGTLILQAGRNVGPLTSANDALILGYLRPTGAQYPGIRTVGDQNNLWLPREGASILVAVGTGPGVELDTFASKYIDPSVLHDPLDPADTLGTPDYSESLVDFVSAIEADRLAREGTASSDVLDAASAWEIFRGLPEEQRLLFAYGVFLDILDRTGLDYNDPDSRFAQQYARGFDAIGTLFPAALGYTLNDRSGGDISPVATGTLDMRGSTIQTQRGGDILIVGPGGDVVVGSASAPPLVPASAQTTGIGPNNQGILVLEQGRIRMFTDQSVLLAQSRIFTEQGGDLLIWSSNGDINAGKGAKTSSEIPPPAFLCDTDQFCVLDVSSQVSGAGIAVLQTIAGQPSGTANLVAPGGTVDAGDAGIRVSGSLNVAALKVANADNIAVSGNASGVPTTTVDTGALGAASSVSASVSQSAVQSGSGARSREEQSLMVNVEVLGFGGVPEDED